MKKIRLPQLQPFKAKLGLRWKISYFLAPKETICRVVSNPVSQEHEIWIHPGVRRDFQFFLPDTVHELCHCKLAEAVDPIFSTIAFRKGYGELKGEAAKKFEHRARMIYWAQAHVDIWVNDLRHSHWPELTQADHESFSQSILELAQIGQWQMLESREGILGIAQHLAEVRRYGLQPVDFSSVFQGIGEKIKSAITELSEFYESLPRLSYEREKDLQTLEKSVKQAAKRLELPISPQLIEDEGRIVWQILELENSGEGGEKNAKQKIFYLSGKGERRTRSSGLSGF
ncbi:MAG: hypothetical protein QME57_04490 [Patescibacteria group bacterium]|nr:hypothetical protein [Patescibacteria group bacterium]